jgi:hypothetical protein
MKASNRAFYSLIVGFFCLTAIIACQSRSADFETLSGYLKYELNYTKSIQNQTVLIVNLNTCHVCTDRIADNLRKTDKSSPLLLIFSADAQKDIDNYLVSNHINGKHNVISDLKNSLPNQPFYDGSAGYFFKVGKNKIEKMIRFDINHNFEIFEKELLYIN